jgi:hypothetical protein
MITQDKKEYIIAHCHEMTLEEMGQALGCSKENVHRILKPTGLKAITKHDRKVNMIREQNGTKTAEQLAELIGCCRMQVYDICKDYGIPYLAEEIHPPQYVYKENPPPPPLVAMIYSNHTLPNTWLEDFQDYKPYKSLKKSESG